MTRLLFVCSRNQLRSPTAEVMWSKRNGFEARSAGTSPHARRTISPADIRWADVVLVMETKHRDRLRATFARLLEHKRVHCLDIPDDYRFMEPALVALLDVCITACLASEVAGGSGRR
ncbi:MULTISPECIES: phosphotyrosine protein phosphatase [Stenotrophomonas]|uniref:low molecular weight protein tyrosine phosphatase family protein n=1 Tax=Stenotrophomonas TaxID=40323 RepID=UPI00077042E6|nr:MULTISPECIES: phosphotyrosine protein phosphatase [Stenotrophomonas]AMJ55639.1 phosphotyrosine protein phosphatase [Stenotrophomonas sp. KCTC 12332]